MRKPKAGRKPVRPLRRKPSKAAKRVVPSPVLEWLFQRMADESPGLLRAVSLTKDKIRLRHTVHVGPSDYAVKDFEVLLLEAWAEQLVEVRVRGLPSVSVSIIPSAVLAVAFR